MMVMRKIIHVDMDAFYASVEQRDDPAIRNKPVIVAWSQEPRSVVVTASYEARKFGVHSAMPAQRAFRLCPEGIFVRPNFERYREVSRQIREIFLRHTPLVEPLSLDEAYLDVTEELTGIPTATETAMKIRQEIRNETNLTASAGVAPNKFLAKIASDWKKPDGLFVIRPPDVERFLLPLPVRKLPGVGKVTEKTLEENGIATIADLRRMEKEKLEGLFGRYGQRLWSLARGLDEHPVIAQSPTKSISSENTFRTDITLAEVASFLESEVQRVWQSVEKHKLVGRTVTVKLRTPDFRTVTRRITPDRAPATPGEVLELAMTLLERFPFPHEARFRLAGVGLSGFEAPDGKPQGQPTLF
ncbi:MAG: DNA polymerase IV [Acidobacteriota bacterium]